MALKKITKSEVEQMQPGQLIWDAKHREAVRGFGVRRQKDGAFYILRYRFDGRQTFYSIGQHGSPWTPDTARDEAIKLLGDVKSGINPVAERKQKRTAAKADRLGDVIEQYLEKRQREMKPRAFEEIARHLRKHAKPLHPRSVSELDRRAIKLRLDEIGDASGPVARNRVRSSLSALYTWAIGKGLCEINPVASTTKAAEEKGRERVLSDRELAEIWSALGADHFSDIVRLLILTGQPREGIGGLRWSEIGERDGLPVIVLPAARTKNGREHVLSLSPAAYAIIARQPRRKGRDLIFGMGKGGFSGWSGSKKALDDRILAARQKRDRKAKPMPAWTLHDLRRTCASVCHDRLEVLPHIIEAILNRVSGHKAGVAGIDNRVRYLGPMREALSAWATHVAGITAQ